MKESNVNAACISVVAPSTVIHARYLCMKLRARFPQLKIVIGLWGMPQGVTDATRRLRDSGADEVVTTLADAVVQLAKYAPTHAEQMIPAPIPAVAEERASPRHPKPEVDITNAKARQDHTSLATEQTGRRKV